MRAGRGALPAAILLAGLASLPVGATQPVVRPDPAPHAEAFINCKTEGGTTAYLPRFLRAVVNATPTPQELVVLQRGCGAVLAKVEDLNALRIITDGKPTVAINGEDYVNLNSFDGLVYQINTTVQAVTIEGEPYIFEPTVFDFDPPPSPAPPPPWGAFLNYGGFVTGTFGQDDRLSSASAGLGVFGAPGVLTSDWIASQVGDDGSVNRIGTTYTRDFVDRISTLRVGDIRSRGDEVGSSASLGGVQYSTNFATRPLMRTTPQQMMEAAIRRFSTPQLFRSDAWSSDNPRAAFLSSTAAVPYGPVELVNMPTYDNGEYEFVLRDPLGGETRVRQAFFFNQGLLRPGLEDFSFEAGRLRDADQSYHRGFGSGSYQRGMTEVLTIGGHLEGAAAGVSGGGTLLWSVPYVGVVSASAAASDHELSAGTGALASLGVENRYRRLGYALRQQCQNRSFLLPTFSAALLEPPACRTFGTVNGVLPWGHSIGFNAAATTFHGADSSVNLGVRYGTRSWHGARVTAQVAWSNRREENYSFTMRFDYAFSALSRGVGAQRSSSLFNPRNVRAQVRASGTDEDLDATFAALRTSGRIADGNARMEVGSNVNGPEFSTAAFSWAPEKLSAVARIDSNAIGERYSASANSALVLMDNTLFTSGPLSGSFAVVRLGERAQGARVNRVEVDGDGDAVVRTLLAYHPNVVSIDANSVPLDVRFERTNFVAIPAFRSGLLLDPGSRRVRDAILVVTVRERGGSQVPLPLGAWATIDGVEARFPTGEGGEVYVEGLGDVTDVTLHYGAQTCLIEVDLSLDAGDDLIPELGPFECDGIHP